MTTCRREFYEKSFHLTAQRPKELNSRLLDPNKSNKGFEHV